MIFQDIVQPIIEPIMAEYSAYILTGAFIMGIVGCLWLILGYMDEIEEVSNV